MGLFGDKKRRVADEETCASAKNAVERFWGVSDGRPGDLEATEEHLRQCGLAVDQIHALRASLPIQASGTTGQRVARIDRVLKRLTLEA